MAKTMKAIIALGGKLDGSLLKTMSTAEKRLGRLKKVAAIGAAAAVAVGAAAAKGVKESVEAAAAYEKQFAKTSTLLKKGTDLSAYSEEILKLSDKTGIAAGELTESVYQALSASVDQADAIEFAGQAARLASGGFTESSKAIDVLTTVMNAYGKESGLTAERVSDLLITTQNLGKTTVDDLAQYMGKVIPIARAVGTNMENLSTSYAILTKNGIQTADATTYLKGMLNELSKDGSTVSNVLKESTGKSFAQLQQEGASLYDVIDILSQSVDGNSEAFKNLWGKQASSTAALALLNAGSEEYLKTLKAMEDSSGATADAADTMGSTYEKQVKKLNNLFENLKIRVGEKILPVLTQTLEENMPAITELMQNLGNGIGGLFEGLNGIGDFFSPITTGISDAAAALEEHGPAIQNIAEKLGPAFESFGQAAGDAIRGIGEALGPVLEGLSQLLDFLDQAYSQPGMSPTDVMMQDPLYNATGPSGDPGNYGAMAGAMQSYWDTSTAVPPNLVPDMQALSASADAASSSLSAYGASAQEAVAGMDSAAQGVTAIAQSSADASSAQSSAQDSVTSLMGSVQQLPGAATAGADSFSTFASGVGSSMSSAQSTVSSACSSMESTVSGMHLQIPTVTVGALPHFYMSGSFDPKSGAVPSVGVSYYATGGFTKGPIAIAGEAGTEAVISFDKRYREENIGYWMMAGEMLGILKPFAEGGFTDGMQTPLSIEVASLTGSLATAAGQVTTTVTSGTSVDLGGVTFAPNITVTGESKQDVLSQIREAQEEFADYLEELISDLEDNYAPVF